MLINKDDFCRRKFLALWVRNYIPTWPNPNYPIKNVSMSKLRIQNSSKILDGIPITKIAGFAYLIY